MARHSESINQLHFMPLTPIGGQQTIKTYSENSTPCNGSGVPPGKTRSMWHSQGLTCSVNETLITCDLGNDVRDLAQQESGQLGKCPDP